MIKEERHEIILNLLEQFNLMRVSELVKKLNVSDMTIRRDLQELEDKGQLIKVHGGARKMINDPVPFLELSHIEKRNINPKSKSEIAQLIAENICDHETVFLGSGSTIELVYEYLDINFAKIVTNSIYVFDKFKYDDRFELILTGGTYRSKTGSFAGTITNDFVSSINVQKAFIGVNGIYNNSIFNANEDEGVVQRTVFNNANTKYIVADSLKFNKVDFYQFYDLKDIDYLITDSKLPLEQKEKYEKWVEIMNE